MHEGRYFHDTQGLRKPEIGHDDVAIERTGSPDTWERDDPEDHGIPSYNPVTPPAVVAPLVPKADMQMAALRPIRNVPQLHRAASTMNAAVGLGRERRFLIPEHIQDSKETSLKRFAPMIVDGHRFTGLAIGGYKLDPDAALKKAQTALQRQPIALPKIFSDDDLTVYHHFGRGLEAILGSGTIREITSAPLVHGDPQRKLITALADMVSDEIEAGEVEHIKFARQAMQSMFERTTGPASKGSPPALLVIMNLYGFPYIEPGMILDDANARHFLQALYASYKLLWFGLMKDTGLPYFALEGVQDRYTGTSDYDSNTKRGEVISSSTGRSATMDPELYRRPHEREGTRRSRTEKPRARRDAAGFREMLGM